MQKKWDTEVVKTKVVHVHDTYADTYYTHSLNHINLVGKIDTGYFSQNNAYDTKIIYSNPFGVFLVVSKWYQV